MNATLTSVGTKHIGCKAAGFISIHQSIIIPIWKPDRERGIVDVCDVMGISSITHSFLGSTNFEILKEYALL